MVMKKRLLVWFNSFSGVSSGQHEHLVLREPVHQWRLTAFLCTIHWLFFINWRSAAALLFQAVSISSFDHLRYAITRTRLCHSLMLRVCMQVCDTVDMAARVVLAPRTQHQYSEPVAYSQFYVQLRQKAAWGGVWEPLIMSWNKSRLLLRSCMLWYPAFIKEGRHASKTAPVAIMIDRCARSRTARYSYIARPCISRI